MKPAPLPRSVDMLETIFGMRFLVRAGFDVPIENGVVTNTFRIERALPTILYLVERGARVILLTHIGRDPRNSTKPLLEVLSKYVPVRYVNEVVGEQAFGAVMHMKEGTVLLLENIRSCPGEEGNDSALAEKLASYANFYVQEAFSVAHREHASVVTLPKLLPNFAGFDFLREITELRKALVPTNPSLFILGGAKFETKSPLIRRYTDTYTNTFIGGALANDFLKGKGYEVGASLISSSSLAGDSLLTHERLLLPTDVVVEGPLGKRTVLSEGVGKQEKILDVGMQSVEALAPYIAAAKTILWNGTLGNCEAGYDEATKKCAALVAASDAFSVIGGGDTVAAIESLNLMDSFDFVSTGGGAMLDFLEHGTVPGLDVLTPRIG
jgi:phosphoglycerate kinase